jgi:phytoene desaturase
MSDNSVIIIGAGVAGLAAGCYAQMNDYQCHIFEHHEHPGGVAAAWQRGDYLIDGGIHFVMGHKPGTGLYELYRQLGIVPSTRFVDMVNYGRYIDEASGQSLLIPGDLDRLGRELKAAFPEDSRIIDELVSGARSLQGMDMSQVGMAKPPEMTTPLDSLRDMWATRTFIKYMFGKYARPVAEYARGVHDPRLRTLIENLFTPDVPVYFVFMILGILADGQAGLLEGGCRDFVGALEKRYLDLGGKVTYNATVEKILVEARPGGKDAAVGVRLAGGREQRAGTVVSAADGRSTIFHMLDGRYVNDKITKRYATWKTFRPLLLASYGVARTFEGEEPFTSYVLEHPLAIGAETVKAFFARIFNYSSRFAPPDKSVIQVELETSWEHWARMLAKGSDHYAAEKERVAADILERLERHFPGITAQVEVTDVSTPHTTWRYTLNDRGAYEGWLMTPEVFTAVTERTLPGLDNFYMAGQWVMAGGGVPACLYSGQHVAQLLCRRDGKRFAAQAG